MFKKIFLLTMGALLLSTQCFAMAFSQPVKTGFSVIWTGRGMAVRNASANEGEFYKQTYKGKTRIFNGSENNNPIMYGKGVARYGNGSDALYAHYNSYNMNNDSKIRFGGKDINNTVPISSQVFGEEIFKINTSEGMTFYMIHTTYDLPDETWWTLIGMREDGTWAKYIDSDSVTVKYFGEAARAGYAYVWKGQSICCDNFRVRGDMIVIEYSRYHKDLGQHGRLIKEGEFRFKWDDKAQWFGVDHVLY